MILARIMPWVEETDYAPRIRIEPGKIGAFEVIAVKASEGEIFSCRRAVVKLGDNVIELKWRADERLRQKAVFTAETSATRDQFLKRGIHPQ